MRSKEQALANYLIGEYDLRAISTVQLDTSSSASILGFTTAAADLGVTPQQSLTRGQLQRIGQHGRRKFSIVIPPSWSPTAAPAWRRPSTRSFAAAAGTGSLPSINAFNPTFRTTVPMAELSGVVATMTWSFTSADQMSAVFLNAFIRAYGEIPGAVEAASYDSVQLIADALRAPGSLRDNLANAPETGGVQGTLNALGHPAGELSSNVAIVRLGELGAPEVLARYVGGMRLADTNAARDRRRTPPPRPRRSHRKA